MQKLISMTWSPSILEEVSEVFRTNHDVIVSALILEELPKLDFGEFKPIETVSYNGAKLLYDEQLLGSKKEAYYLMKMIEFSLDANSNSATKERLLFIFNCAKIRQYFFVQQLAIRAYVENFCNISQVTEISEETECQIC